MLINIVTSSDLFNASSWSIMTFIPQTAIAVNNECELIKLGEIVRERKENMGIQTDGFLNYVGLENIEPWTGRLVSYSAKKACEVKSACKKFEVGDILYGRLRPNLNKAYLNMNIPDGRCSTEIIVLEPIKEKVNPVYLVELLRTKEINERIVNLIKGAALPRVNISDLLSIEIPIPKIEVQNDLANRINQKRIELEEHIRQAQEIPLELNQMIVAAYS